MTASDFDNRRKYEITELDNLRIKFMSVGATVNGECGLWTVNRYEDEYVIVPNDSSGKILDGIKTIEQLIEQINNYNHKN